MSTPRTLEDVHYQPMPPRRPPGRRSARLLLGIAAAVLLLLLIAGFWMQRQVSGHPHGAAVSVSIPKGASTSSIGGLLHRNGVIGNTTVWRIYTAVKRPGPLQSGDFRFRHDENMGHVLSVLKGGGQVTVHRLTIPEGSTLRQVAAKVGTIPNMNADRFLAVAQSGTVRSDFQPPGSTNLEGLLFPDTYFVDKKDDEGRLLTRMVAAFDKAATDAGIRDAAAKAGVTPYEAIIVASLVEREAKVDEDRGMIARVIYNRLGKNMKLGIDATVEYAIGAHKPKLTNADLDIDSPYNTRKFAGLPPTPIAAPGQKSLEAAVNPTPGPWLFYVLADANGKHSFATTDAEFQQQVRQARAKGLL
jgi:UPF0755 protein